MHAVDRPQARERRPAVSDPLLCQGDRVANRRMIGPRNGQMRVAAQHAVGLLLRHVPLEGEDHLHHGGSCLREDAPHEGFVGGQRLRRGAVDVVVGREVEKDQIGLPPHNVSLQTEHAQL